LAATRDLPTIAFFRAGPLLRRNGPVPGILAAARPTLSGAQRLSLWLWQSLASLFSDLHGKESLTKANGKLGGG